MKYRSEAAADILFIASHVARLTTIFAAECRFQSQSPHGFARFMPLQRRVQMADPSTQGYRRQRDANFLCFGYLSRVPVMRAKAYSFQHVPIHYSVRIEDHPRYGGETSVLFLRDANGSFVKYQPQEDFSHAHTAYSDATRRKAPRGFGLLIDHTRQNAERYVQRFGEDWSSSWRIVLQDFCNALRHGTISSEFVDHTGLFWPPITSDNVLSGYGTWLDRFFDWMVDQERTAELADVLPFFSQVSDQAFGRAVPYERPNRYRFLAHVKPNSRSGLERPVMGAGIFRESSQDGFEGPDLTAVPLSPVYAFPKEHLVSLIDEGFCRKGHRKDPLERVDYTGRLDALIALGGLRGSERLHMWVNDLQIVGGKVFGFLRHPEKFRENCGRSREQLLLERYDGMRPRTKGVGRERVGFKNPRLNPQHWATIRWLEVDHFHEYFAQQLKLYVGGYRKSLMDRRRKEGLGDHPFLLVSNYHDPDRGIFVGDPISPSAAARRWKRAVESLGLVYKKEEGTTKHSTRHLFGQTLEALGTPIQDIAKDMHHRSIFSPLKYLSRSDEDAHETFELNRLSRPEVFESLGTFQSIAKGSPDA
ncbi:site-specific integrase [Neorhizobium tomejilense]|uniref:site-specific integrase n=1 Tax=Neorhizobium tomejilense TaxID=2093828 RepID=UPI00155E0897|nr:site-specific integrase [Neorhizobium tomejilense]